MTPEEKRLLHNKQAVEYRKIRKKDDPDYYKKLWAKHKDSWNSRRVELYHNDPEYRAKKIAKDKEYKKSEKGQAMLHKQTVMENARVRSRRNHLKNRDKDRAKNKEYRLNNKEYVQNIQTVRRRDLHDNYVGLILTHDISTHWKDIDPNLIELKRQLIILRRTIKQMKNEHI
jgi:hypothetical protein